MSRLDLVGIAMDLLAIHKDIPYRFKNRQNDIHNFEMETFTQMWGNTSGGFETIGGSAMTVQRTYVFIPVNCDDNCIVYFDGRFAYSVPYSDVFIKDVRERRIAGYHHKDKYLSIE